MKAARLPRRSARAISPVTRPARPVNPSDRRERRRRRGMATGVGLLTAEELLHMPDDDMRHELVAGVLTTMPPPTLVHGVCASRIATALSNHVRNRDAGVISTEAGFTLARDPDTVRAPDVS